jgi:hypothetical protein
VDAKVMVFHAQPRETERLAAKHEAGLLRPTFSDRAWSMTTPRIPAFHFCMERTNLWNWLSEVQSLQAES